MGAEANLASALAHLVRRDGAIGLLRWWGSETVNLLPMRWRHLLAAPRALRVRIGPAVSAGAVTNDGVVINPADPGASRAALDLAFAACPTARGNVWLVLEASQLMVRQAVLPLAAEQDLGSALAFDLDRLTPLPAERALFGYQVRARDVENNVIRLDLVAAARDSVNAGIAALRALGLRVVGVGADVRSGSLVSFNLLPEAERDVPVVPVAVVVSRLLAGLAALLACAAIVTPVWLKRQAAIDMTPRLEEARAMASASEKLGAEIEKLAGEHNFLLARKHLQPSMATLLEELSRELPDNTWVQQLEVKAPGKIREIQIAGETGASSALIATLEKTGTLANATFKSPLTKGAGPNTERFLVAAELKPRALPEPIPEASLGASPASASSPSGPSAPEGSAAGSPPASGPGGGT